MLKWVFIAFTVFGLNWLVWIVINRDEDGEDFAIRGVHFLFGQWFDAFAPRWLMALVCMFALDTVLFWLSLRELPEPWQQEIAAVFAPLRNLLEWL